MDYVQPGMSTVQTAHMARLVNLTRPGRYTVRVSRVDPATKAVVKSNEITLNVVPVEARAGGPTLALQLPKKVATHGFEQLPVYLFLIRTGWRVRAPAR